MDLDRLRELVGQGLPDAEVGAQLDPPVSASTVRRKRVELGLKGRPPGPVPRVPEDRTASFLLRCTPEQLEQLHERAAAAKLSTQDYLHALLFPPAGDAQ